MDTSYEQTMVVTRVGTSVERFTPDFEVISVSLAISSCDDGEVISIQRAYGDDADPEDGVCLVLSPSQQCVFDPFEELILGRHSLGMRFTAEAEEMLEVSSALFNLCVSDDVYQELKAGLSAVCCGASCYRCVDSANEPPSA